MTITLPSSSTQTGTVLNVADDDEIFIASSVSLISTGGTAVAGIGSSGGNADITVAGTIVGVDGMDLDTILNSVVTITGTGAIYGSANGTKGLELLGADNLVVNSGEITGGSQAGVYLTPGSYSGGNTLVNRGVISGDGAGVAGEGDILVENHGTISGRSFGVSFSEITFPGSNPPDFSGLQPFELVNTGTISGGGGSAVVSFAAGGMDILNSGTLAGNVRSTNEDSVNTLTNIGEIAGDVDFRVADESTLSNSGTITGDYRGGNGEDVVRNSGEIGEVDLGRGNDVYRGRGDGFAREVDGGSGKDRLIGSGQDDNFKGGKSNDTLKGRGGDDELSGGEGRDTLKGGTGDDTLTGGGSADTFVFGTRSGDDVITDFDSGTDLLDFSAFGLSDGGDALGFAVFRANGDVFFDLDPFGGDGTLIIEGVGANGIDANDFVF